MKRYAKRFIFCAVFFVTAAGLVLSIEPEGTEAEPIESESIEAESTEEEQSTDPVSNPETAFQSSENKLRRYAYDDETTAVLSTDSPLHLVSGNSDMFVQTRYNARGQLVSRTVWRTGEGDDTVPAVDAVTEYFYSASSTRPEKRLVTSSKTQEETVYLANGKESRINLYKIDDGKKEFVLQTNFRYTADGKLLGTAQVVPMPAVTEAENANPQIPTVADDEIRYIYTSKSKNADTERYQNGKLIMKTEYASDTKYTETRYLDFDFSVETTYENDILALERFLQNNKEIRRQVYTE
jgi:hypothetical protein